MKRFPGPGTPACLQGGFRFLGFYGLRAARGAPSGFTIRRLPIAYGDQLGPSGIVINTGPFEHIGFAIFAIEAAGALVRGVLLRRLIIQAALRARKHDRGLCYGGHPAIMRRWLAGSIRYCTGFEGTRAPLSASQRSTAQSLAHISFRAAMTGTLSLCAQHRGFQLTTRCGQTE